MDFMDKENFIPICCGDRAGNKRTIGTNVRPDDIKNTFKIIERLGFFDKVMYDVKPGTALETLALFCHRLHVTCLFWAKKKSREKKRNKTRRTSKNSSLNAFATKNKTSCSGNRSKKPVKNKKQSRKHTNGFLSDAESFPDSNQNQKKKGLKKLKETKKWSMLLLGHNQGT